MTEKKKKRARIDSTAEIVKVFAAAHQEIKPPEYMKLKSFDLPFFDAIIAEAPNLEWTSHKVQLAVILARDCADLDYQQNLYRREGPMITNPDTGEQMINQRQTVIKMFQANISTMRRSLGLHARGTGGEAREYAKRRAIANAAQSAAKSSISDLIPQRRMNG